MKPKIITLLSLLFILSCILYSESLEPKKYTINKSSKAISKSERIKYIVIHYTHADRDISMRMLTKGNVSSHYLITDIDKEPIYKLVDEKYAAWHAGLSSFDGRTAINDTSVGIEIVHTGYIRNETNTNTRKRNNKKIDFVAYENYMEYDNKQIEKLAYLLKEISKKYDIHPKNIIGHSDIAPLRKQDPGPKFPWKYLYDTYSIGIWYDEIDYYDFYNDNTYKKASVSNIKQEFIKYGYSSMPTNKVWDNESRKVLYAFQTHFRPSKIDGNIDEESYAIIRALNKKVEQINEEKGNEKLKK